MCVRVHVYLDHRGMYSTFKKSMSVSTLESKDFNQMDPGELTDRRHPRLALMYETNGALLNKNQVQTM